MDSDDNTDQSKQIEAENEINCASFVTTQSTSWPIVLGCLDDTVVCESSLCPIDSADNSVSRKPALVLRRPFQDCGPCEIKINFEQKHEIRQVYIRSTARVYEIYYAADAQSMNEYLCSVRCGMAAKNDEFVGKEEYLQKTMPSSSSGFSKLLEEGQRKTDSGSSTSEDGWVEIKDPDSSGTEDGDGSHSSITEAGREREKQDFYEATAEITDSNPCTSMTIRLLSIQSGELVYLDEVYVFVDSVECDDVKSTSNTEECSTASPFMSMLVPTLLQLSKSRMSQIGESRDPNSKVRTAHQDVFHNMSSASTSAKIQQEEIPWISNEQESVTDKLNSASDQVTRLEVLTQPSAKIYQEEILRISNEQKAVTDRLNSASDQVTRLEVPKQPSNRGVTGGVNISFCHIEKTLDELVSRMARIEEFCLRFEERMISPITSMDARLEKVEQQLELLNEKFQLPQAHASTRIHAPEFSGNASESNLSCNDGNMISSCKASESLEKDYRLSDEVPASLSDTSLAANAYLVPDVVFTSPEFSTSSGPLKNDACPSDEVVNPVSDMPSTVSAHLVPSLVVTAPEFSYGDEEEEIDTSKSVRGSPRDNPKKPQSIDDALAFALAGFISSTSTQHLTSDVASDTSKTDYTSDEAGVNILASPHVACDELLVPHHMNAASLTSSGAVAEDGEHEVPPFDRNSEQPVQNTGRIDCVLGKESADSCLVHDAEERIYQAEKTIADDDIVITEEVGNFDKDATKTSSEFATKVDSSSSEEVTKETSDVLHSILNLQINPVVDYKIPILDVKFASQEFTDIKTSTLEALLIETTATNVEGSSAEERDGVEIRDQGRLIEPDYNKVIVSESVDHSWVGPPVLDYSSNLTFNKGTLQELPECCKQDMPVALL